MPSPYDLRTPTCSACRRFRPCLGTGPAPAKILFLGEGPGESEDWKRLPFIGQSGKELDHQYLPLSGLSRPEVHITNAIKCRQGKKGGDDPDPLEVLTCARHHLPGELAQVRPELIVTLGAVALRLFGDHSLEMHHGRPLYNQTFCNWTGTVFPIYHPAAGLRKSEYMIELQEDFRALSLYRRGKLHIPTDLYPNPVYRDLRTPDDVDAIFTSHLGAPFTPLRYYGWVEVAVDTETDEGHIWCLTFSLTPGTGYMIRADNPDTIARFRWWLHALNPMVDYHNYLFDAPVLREVNIVTPRWCDTMQEAYQCCTLPQALKVLAWRYCGMEMQEYEDLVMPYAMAEAIGYLDLGSKTILPEYIAGLPWKRKVLKCSGGKEYGGKHESTAIEFTEPLTVGCPVCGKPKGSGNMERDKGGVSYIWDRAARILNDVMEENSNPLKRWAAIPQEEREVMEKAIGKMPKPSIKEVPFEEAVVYACRDADATIRVKPVIRRHAAEMGRRVG